MFNLFNNYRKIRGWENRKTEIQNEGAGGGGEEYFYLCIPIFVSVQYLESFSLVRQALAVAILMYAFKTYSERRIDRQKT